jgi:rhamnulokinase
MSGVTALAFDLGASSGRAVKVRLADGGLACEEIHRFDNTPYTRSGHLYWDFAALMNEVRQAIAKAGDLDSVAFDTWGVDFGLLDENGRLLEDPIHYRDTRTDGYPDLAYPTLAADDLYRQTGNQLMGLNTLFQLLALRQGQPDLWRRARTLLFMPNLFASQLGARPACEQTIASTSQMLDPVTRDWSDRVLQAFAIPRTLLPQPETCGAVIGRLPGGAKIIATAGHDTQCAVAALPDAGPGGLAGAAFLSCGTWSLLGVELDAPILTAESRSMGFSNELGADGQVHYLKNMAGLWLIQESRREWRRQGQDLSYAQLENLARTAEPLSALINPDAPDFARPGNIPDRVSRFCQATGQRVPQSIAAIMRCFYDSLALSYRLALQSLQVAAGRRVASLHIVGGGVKDPFLCQLTADATGLPVVAGPAEAAALGNSLVQFAALGALPSLAAGRAMIAQTLPPRVFNPVYADVWDLAARRFQTIMSKGAK